MQFLTKVIVMLAVSVLPQEYLIQLAKLSERTQEPQPQQEPQYQQELDDVLQRTLSKMRKASTPAEKRDAATTFLTGASGSPLQTMAVQSPPVAIAPPPPTVWVESGSGSVARANCSGSSSAAAGCSGSTMRSRPGLFARMRANRARRQAARLGSRMNYGCSGSARREFASGRSCSGMAH